MVLSSDEVTKLVTVLSQAEQSILRNEPKYNQCPIFVNTYSFETVFRVRRIQNINTIEGTIIMLSVAVSQNSEESACRSLTKAGTIGHR